MSGAIAVAGLSGFIGRGLVDRLREAGARVVAVDRRQPFGLDPTVTFHASNLASSEDAEMLAKVFELEAVTAVVQAEPAPTSGATPTDAVQDGDASPLLQACARAGVERVVLASTTALYGAHRENPNYLGEEHPLRASAPLLARVAGAENAWSRFRESHPDVAVTILRPCWIAGPSYADAMPRYLAMPVVPTPLGYDPLLQFVHEDDCLDVFERAALSLHPGVFNVVGRGVAPLSNLLRQAGRRALPVPSFVLERGAQVLGSQYTDLPEGAVDFLRFLCVADGTRASREFGEPEYSSREAWMAFVSARRMRRYR